VIDLHTHILPGIDDGAADPAASIAMLRMEAEQGVDTVVVTPHFYRDREQTEHFLARRRRSALQLDQALAALPDGERDHLPRILLGAEVAWVPNLSDLVDLSQLCMGESRSFLLELPFSPWSESMLHQIYDLMSRTGLIPVLAHLERYWRLQRPELLREVLELGVPVQISADALLRPFSRGTKLLQQGQAHLVASDCHGPAQRPPNLGQAMHAAARKLGTARQQKLEYRAEQLLNDLR
jgi:protein-tyrosine phosphatase